MAGLDPVLENPPSAYEIWSLAEILYLPIFTLKLDQDGFFQSSSD